MPLQTRITIGIRKRLVGRKSKRERCAPDTFERFLNCIVTDPSAGKDQTRPQISAVLRKLSCHVLVTPRLRRHLPDTLHSKTFCGAAARAFHLAQPTVTKLCAAGRLMEVRVGAFL